MNKEKISLPSITLVGLSVRTNNADEQNPEKAQIGHLLGQYFQNDVPSKLKDRTNPGTTYMVYTDYASDEHGDYTCFFGEQVDSLDRQNLNELKSMAIPANTYQKFTTETGNMVEVVVKAWQEIWQMTPTDFEGTRNYKADFQIHDHRAADMNNATVDIYVGIDEQ
jgi:predicted transcriptional regulator YdeE